MKPVGVQMGNAKPVFGTGLGPGAFMRPAGNRAAGGANLPDFSTALVAVAMWGLVPSYQGDVGNLVGISGDLDFVDLPNLTVPPYKIDLTDVSDAGTEASLIVVTWYNQVDNGMSAFSPLTDPCQFALINPTMAEVVLETT